MNIAHPTDDEWSSRGLLSNIILSSVSLLMEKKINLCMKGCLTLLTLLKLGEGEAGREEKEKLEEEDGKWSNVSKYGVCK